MVERYLIGLDIGGGGGRSLLVNAASGETHSVFKPWRLLPDPEAGGFAFRIDTGTVWRVLGETTRAVLREAGIDPKQVVGISAASMRHSLVAIDKRGEVLLATPNRDSRAVEQGMSLESAHGKAIYQSSGHYPNPIFLAPRLLWLKENHPENYQKMQAAVPLSDWAGFMLTGELASEPAQAAESLLLDLGSRKWSTEWIKTLGLNPKTLPGLKPAGTRLGKLTRTAGAHLGLEAGIPVAVGGPDTQCGLLGMGVVEEGQIGVVAGTTTPVQMVIQKPIVDPVMRTWTGLHVLPRGYVLESNAGQTGSTLEWVARLLYPDSPFPVARLAAGASGSVPGANGMRSTIGAAVFNASALEPPVDNLTFSSVIARAGEGGSADVARAVLEGMACAVRANIEQVQQVSEVNKKGVFIGGGISRSGLWTAMISNILDEPVKVSSSSEATALGAAICAGVAAGVFKDLVAGSKTLVRYSREHAPEDELSETYQSLYREWQVLRRERRSADETAAGQITGAMLAGGAAGEESGQPAAIRPRIYISAEVDEEARGRLAELGDVTYKPYRTEGILLAGDDLVKTLQGYQVFVTEVDIVDAAALLNLPDLRLVVVCRGNPVNIDIDACTAAGVPVVNTPGRNADAVADLAVGFILMLARRMQAAAAFLRQPGGEAGDLGRMGQAHEEFLGMELWRRTVGIIGGGAIGRKVAQRLLPFGARVLLYDPYISDEDALKMGAEKMTLETLLEQSDFISLHAPVTDGTRGMINAKTFGQIREGTYLVNTARSALVDQDALIEALRNGKLGGYATDVFPVEPPGADDPLLAFPNVIATPHIGGNTLEVSAHQGQIIADEIALLLGGSRPKNLINISVVPAFSWTGARRMDESFLNNRAAAPGPGSTDLEVSSREATPAAIPATATHTVTPAVVSAAGEGNTSMDTSETRKKMTEILKGFTAAIAADPEMVNFAKGKNVVFLFTVKDLDQAFHMSFVDGKVTAGLEAPPREPDVKLKMSADILDGMFTGRINATKAATSGKLSFSGDTGKAMSFIRIQGTMSRLYQEVRAKVGDPGDLTQLSAAPVAGAAPAAVAVVPAPAQGYQAASAVIHRTGDIRDELLKINNELFAQGLITSTGGNISARCDDNDQHAWITPSRIFKGDLRADMMVRIDLDGHVVGESEYSASSEKWVHTAIYKLRPDVTAVIHAHAPQATLMALTGTHFQPISMDAAFFGDIPVVPFVIPGTDEIAKLVVKALGEKGVGVLMQNHGLVVAGGSLRSAADTTEAIEITAEKLLACRAMGVQPALIPEEIVKQLREIGTMMA
jgi:L-ribulose-5-phosphate 4-epimerase